MVSILIAISIQSTEYIFRSIQTNALITASLSLSRSLRHLSPMATLIVVIDAHYCRLYTSSTSVCISISSSSSSSDLFCTVPLLLH